ncbi:MAG: hypothetical protein RI564_01680, partial [Gracilimonas sp.]|nr:hypothetical protein [Gracilimonas sp.]
ALSVDVSGKLIQSGVNDAVFVYAAITDENGVTVHGASNEVHFEIEGDGKLVGQNPINAEAGVASVLVRVGESSGVITVRAISEGLETGTTELTVK